MRDPHSMTRRAALCVLAMLLISSAAFADPMPAPEMPVDTAVDGATKIPVTMRGTNEILGAEATATPAVPPPLAIDAPIDPTTYVCGPGDLFELNFWGKQNLRVQFAADLQGQGFISKVGYVPIAGKTLAAVNTEVVKMVHARYPGLQFNLTLVGPRTFLVHVAGNVKEPGSLKATATERVSSVLARAGGSTGSRRQITIHRKGSADATADLVLYDETGDTRYDPYVLDGDVIQVPYAMVTVKVEGAVRKPGTYELVSTKDLDELLQLAGGLSSTAARSLPIRVVRKHAKQQATSFELPFQGISTPNAPLNDEDVVLVHSATDLTGSVLLIGATAAADNADAATTSARLPVVAGDTVLSLIDRAGGIKAPGDLSHSYISRPTKGGMPQVIPLDLDALLVRRDFHADKPVQMGDTIVVPPMHYSIAVDGAVMRSGLYTYNPAFGIREYIALAGGRTHNARDLDEVRLVQPDGKTLPYRSDLKLNPGDAIVVPERSYTSGEVVQITLAVAGFAVSALALAYAIH